MKSNNVGIVAFAFGRPKYIEPNEEIGKIVSRKARELNCPVYTQSDVPIEIGVKVDICAQEYYDSPPPTLRIARGAVKWAKKQGIDEIFIAAAEPHLWRALRDVKRAVREAGEEIKVSICLGFQYYSEYFWFCCDSTQKRTRSRRSWNARERILKILPFFLYKRIAK